MSAVLYFEKTYKEIQILKTMVLDAQSTEKIKSLVYQKPRTINELALALEKNWRTADRYVEELVQKTGSIKTLTFREGTRGALKLVYWNNSEKIYSTDVQEELFKKIELGINKSDFSPFEIYQYLDPNHKHAYYEEIENEKTYNYRIETLVPYFESAEKEIFIFAGNLAFIHLVHKEKTLFDYLKDCIERGVFIKIITYVNLIDIENIEKVLSLNSGLKDPLVEIRHEIIPVRAYLFDSSIARFGEIASGQKKVGQLQKTIAFYYEFREKEWVEWIQKLFWKKFQKAIPSNRRIENIRSIKKWK